MTKTTKIILLSTGSLILGVGAFFGIRYMVKKRKAKRQADQLRLMAQLPTTQVTPSTPTSTTSPNTPTASGTTSLGVPVVMTSYTSTEPTGLSSTTYNPNSAPFKKLDQKLKSLYYILAPLEKKNGKIVYVETADFKPEKPNTEVRVVMLQTFWREAFNSMNDIIRGFNLDEKDNATKAYGNGLIDIFKKHRLEYLFPSKTSDGKETMFNPSADWYLEAEKKSVEKNLKTDFWKTV